MQQIVANMIENHVRDAINHLKNASKTSSGDLKLEIDSALSSLIVAKMHLSFKEESYDGLLQKFTN